MLKTDGACPHCGNELLNYEPREWKYGSPIRTCKKCGGKYIDQRYHEIVIEGIAPDAMSVKTSFTALLVGLVCSAVAFCINFITIQLTNRYSLKLAFMGVVGVVMAIAMLVDIIRIKIGAKERKFAALREESVRRLQDRNYAHELASVGYPVPEEYL